MSMIEESKINGTYPIDVTNSAAFGLLEKISKMGPNVKGIEIGVSTGFNSYIMIEECPNISKIVGIDPFEGYQDWSSFIPQDHMDFMYTVFLDNYEHMKDKFELIKLKSSAAATRLKNEDYDFVFIDGDHSLRAVLTDLDKYVPKIKKGGLIAGHDIGLQGVHMAVTNWTKRHGIDLNKIQVLENTAWCWVKE